ncbi:MAG: helix-turn-helix transcriptional regulator [Syntrophales bacterium]
MQNLLTEKMAAELLNIGVQTLRNDRSKGQGIPYIKMRKQGNRGSIRYRLCDIQEYLENHMIRPQEVQDAT